MGTLFTAKVGLLPKWNMLSAAREREDKTSSTSNQPPSFSYHNQLADTHTHAAMMHGNFYITTEKSNSKIYKFAYVILYYVKGVLICILAYNTP